MHGNMYIRGDLNFYTRNGGRDMTFVFKVAWFLYLCLLIQPMFLSPKGQFDMMVSIHAGIIKTHVLQDSLHSDLKTSSYDCLI